MTKLPEDRSEVGFTDYKPAYSQVQAAAEANRCFYCVDAPCISKCPTAINIPGGVTADMKDPPAKDKYLVLYCLGGMRSPAAGEKMRADGYPHVLVWGGIRNWPYRRESSTG